jgi:hypothetical protein
MLTVHEFGCRAGRQLQKPDQNSYAQVLAVQVAAAETGTPNSILALYNKQISIALEFPSAPAAR